MTFPVMSNYPLHFSESLWSSMKRKFEHKAKENGAKKAYATWKIRVTFQEHKPHSSALQKEKQQKSRETETSRNTEVAVSTFIKQV